jgi:hypothetical protein
MHRQTDGSTRRATRRAATVSMTNGRNNLADEPGNVADFDWFEDRLFAKSVFPRAEVPTNVGKQIVQP